MLIFRWESPQSGYAARCSAVPQATRPAALSLRWVLRPDPQAGCEKWVVVHNQLNKEHLFSLPFWATECPASIFVCGQKMLQNLPDGYIKRSCLSLVSHKEMLLPSMEGQPEPNILTWTICLDPWPPARFAWSLCQAPRKSASEKLLSCACLNLVVDGSHLCINLAQHSLLDAARCVPQLSNWACHQDSKSCKVHVLRRLAAPVTAQLPKSSYGPFEKEPNSEKTLQKSAKRMLLSYYINPYIYIYIYLIQY